jgi:hypothetical protein
MFLTKQTWFQAGFVTGAGRDFAERVGLLTLEPKAGRRRAGFPACRFTGLSSPVFGTGDWKIARTGGQEGMSHTGEVQGGIRAKGPVRADLRRN